eukprot:TRINITY_DN8997_c0_g1_i5.p2 TRINITY_DN8997_c0_g1~~TRINITY_DN8997_c0_g1_i5.p2  ORF type:complete len:181 (+),score=32.66 TRINITY_DN8997_c0_g1_i5:25-567(+)
MQYIMLFFFFSSRRRHTRCSGVSWARRCVQETVSTQSTWGKWPGSEAGCHCQLSKDSKIEVFSGACTSEQLGSNKCQQIQKTTNRSIDSWNGQSFCAAYQVSALFPKNKSCPYSSKYCSQHICVGKNELCPLSGLTIKQAQKDDIVNDKQIIYNESHFIILQREDRQPLVRLRVQLIPQL